MIGRSAQGSSVAGGSVGVEHAFRSVQTRSWMPSVHALQGVHDHVEVHGTHAPALQLEPEGQGLGAYSVQESKSPSAVQVKRPVAAQMLVPSVHSSLHPPPPPPPPLGAGAAAGVALTIGPSSSTEPMTNAPFAAV